MGKSTARSGPWRRYGYNLDVKNDPQHSPCLVLFTKPARPGRVKTRLVGESFTAEQAAALHAAFVGDLGERLLAESFTLRVAWDLDPEDTVPRAPWPDVTSVRQEGDDLGERLFRALTDAGGDHPAVAALGSDHPQLSMVRIHRAFDLLLGRGGGDPPPDVVLGPAEDGGYYLVAVRGGEVPEALFRDVPWSTPRVLETTLERCRRAGLEVELLEKDWDVDRPEDVRRLAGELLAGEHRLPRTRDLLQRWGDLERLAGDEVGTEVAP